MKGLELLLFSRSMSTSLRGKRPKLVLNSLVNENLRSKLLAIADDGNQEKCSRDQHFKTINSPKIFSVQLKHGSSVSVMAPSFDAIYKSLDSSQRFSSTSFIQSPSMIRMYHTSPNQNESVDPNSQHHDEKYTGSQEKRNSKKEKLQNAAKRGSNLAKQGATSVTELVRKYGWTFIGTYGSIYILTLGSLFAGVDSGLLDPTILTDIQFPWSTATSEGLDNAATVTTDANEKETSSAVQIIASYLESFEFTKPYAKVFEENLHLSNLAIAWVATKVTEPIRLGITVAILPRVSKFLEPSQNKSESGKD